MGHLKVHQQVVGQGLRAADPATRGFLGRPVDDHPLHQRVAPGQAQLCVERFALFVGAAFAQGDGCLLEGPVLLGLGKCAQLEQGVYRQAVLVRLFQQAQ